VNKTTILLAGIVLAGSACSAGREHQAGPAQPAVDVRVYTCRVEPQASVFEAGGVVRSRTTATLVSRILADVQEVMVRPGDRVRAGQPLVRLDGRELTANRSRAEAALAAVEQGTTAAASARDGARAALTLAAATHRRVTELRAKNSATPNELDEATGALRAAEARLSGAEAAVREADAAVRAARSALEAATVAASYAVIAAPFDAVVTEKLVEPGNMASPGLALLTVEDPKSYRLEVRVDEARAADLDPARPVAVVLDATPLDAGGPVRGAQPSAGRTVVGRVSEIARALDAGAHAFSVKIDLPADAGVTAGMYGRARFAGTARPALTVPATAIVRHGQLTSVFVAEGSKRARLRLVGASDPLDGRVEITAGLEPGEVVVDAPPPSLVDGAPIRITAGQVASATPTARPAAGVEAAR
jgi:RND family efflux transporter MFP subunit